MVKHTEDKTAQTIAISNNLEPKAGGIEEESLLCERWPVSNLVAILNSPADMITHYEDDFLSFHEESGKLIEALLGNVQLGMLNVRFGVGGVTTDMAQPFELSAAFLEFLWKTERPICHWIRHQASEIDIVASQGRAYAIADAACEVQNITGMSRKEAISNQCYSSYLRQIYLRAFNLYGVFPLKKEELGLKGIDPIAHVSKGRSFDPSACNGPQLEMYAREHFFNFSIDFEVFSILKNLPYRFSLPEQLQTRDWKKVIQIELTSSWMRGESGQWLEAALETLNRYDINQTKQHTG
ncbi:hypothetical protein [Neptunomonas sp.]|uniref:hypothetical protein n=1 Tax=Neptunomonas TaxID=75687 RepID=UPI0035120D65